MPVWKKNLGNSSCRNNGSSTPTSPLAASPAPAIQAVEQNLRNIRFPMYRSRTDSRCSLNSAISSHDNLKGFMKKRGRPPKRSVHYVCSKNMEGNKDKHEVVRKRGRTRKIQYVVEIDSNRRWCDCNTNGDHNHQQLVDTTRPEISEYELMRMKRREELFSVFREQFSLGSDSSAIELPEKQSLLPSRRKYSRRPLPPARCPSLRILGLSPGQRLLRRRKHSDRPQCLCCSWMSHTNNNNSSIHSDPQTNLEKYVTNRRTSRKLLKFD